MSSERHDGETLIEHFEQCVPGGAEALADARLEAEEYAQVPSLVGVSEAAAILGIKSDWLTRLRHTHPLFPEPVVVLKCGPVWLEKHIVRFARIPRPRGRPRKVKE